MIISIVNHTNGKVTDEELQTAIRAINRQIAEDFTPYWSLAATLRLEGRSVSQPDSAQAADMRGDAVIYLWDKSDVEGALGYHFQNNRGIPFGFVFTSIAEELGEPWSITLSHEALELIGDAETNQLAIGPHPDPAQDRSVFFWFEMCDAVEGESYEIDGVKVSNFLLPLYFTGTRDNDEPGARNDYLGRAYKGQTLRSFGINPGGYVGFFDPPDRQERDLLAAGRRGGEAALRDQVRGARGVSWLPLRHPRGAGEAAAQGHRPARGHDVTPGDGGGVAHRVGGNRNRRGAARHAEGGALRQGNHRLEGHHVREGRDVEDAGEGGRQGRSREGRSVREGRGAGEGRSVREGRGAGEGQGARPGRSVVARRLQGPRSLSFGSGPRAYLPRAASFVEPGRSRRAADADQLPRGSRGKSRHLCRPRSLLRRRRVRLPARGVVTP
jgi:hypothetical protein